MSHDERHISANAASPPSREPTAHGPAPEAPPIDEARFRQRYREAPYYSTGRDWSDYAPAYRYGLHAHLVRPGQRFGDVEAQLAEQWDAARGVSRLLWAEARGAALEAWRLLDDRGPSSRDGAETH